MSFTNNDKLTLQRIIEQHEIWKIDVERFVSTYAEMMDLDSDLISVDNNNSSQSNKQIDKNMLKHERSLEERLKAILDDLHLLFNPIIGIETNIFDFLMSNHVINATVGGEGSPKSKNNPSKTQTNKKKKENNSNNNISKLLLILDVKLQTLPFEGLQLFQMFEGRIFRDFNIHMYNHRMTTLNVDSNDKSTICSSSVQFIVDPFRDDSGYRQSDINRPSIIEICDNFVKSLKGKKWKIMSLAGNSVTTPDWLQMTQAVPKKSPHAIYYYSTGRCNQLSDTTSIISINNFNNINCIIFNNMSQNDTSYRRQIMKNNSQLPHENQNQSSIYLSLIAVYSLAGVGSVLMPTWATTFSSQKRFHEDFWDTSIAPDSEISITIQRSRGQGVRNTKTMKMKDWMSLNKVFYGIVNLSYEDS